MITVSAGATARSAAIWHPGVSLDRDAYSLCPHFGKRIPQVRSEFLPDPDHRPVMLPQGGDKPVGRLDEPLRRGRSPALKKVIDHVDHQKGGGFHARSVADRWRGRHGSSDAGSGRAARTSLVIGLDRSQRYIVTSLPTVGIHAHAPSPPAPSAPSRPRTPSGRGFAVDPAYVGGAAAGDCRRAHRIAVGGRPLGDEGVSR